ncbi:type I toxin-antitoxin system toxin Ldr family protein, partial [Escherichia coli]|nr:type I toxin-antitoxin system toxin Ldr family protein [Escherichia coli]
AGIHASMIVNWLNKRK